MRITVRDERYVTSDGLPVDEIPKAIVGANQRWPDDGKGLWDSAARRRPDRQAEQDNPSPHAPLAGGTVANTFDFKGAIGPLDERK
jgi:hypothetical protein